MQNETADAWQPAAEAEGSPRIQEPSPPADHGDAGNSPAGHAGAPRPEEAAELPEQVGAVVAGGGEAKGSAELPEQVGVGQVGARRAEGAAEQREHRLAGQPDGGEDRHADQGGAPARSTTGEPRVDAALRALDRLGQVPVTGHPAIFADVHARIQEVLGELESGPATGAGSRQAG
jgi:hypothetical protein